MPKKRLPANKKIKRGRELSESDDLFLQSCEVALEKILDKEAMEVLPDWDLNQLSDFLTHLVKYGADESDIDKFVRNHTVEPKSGIVDKLGELRKINQKAYRHRFHITSDSLKVAAQPSFESSTPFMLADDNDWVDTLWEICKERKIRDTSQLALSDVFIKCARDSKIEEKTICSDDFMKSNKSVADIDYRIVYQYLASLSDSRSIKEIHSVEATVLLSAFDELIETTLQQLPEFTDVWKEILDRMQFIDYKKNFLYGGLSRRENLGEECLNIMGVPKKLLRLNKFTSDKIIDSAYSSDKSLAPHNPLIQDSLPTDPNSELLTPAKDIIPMKKKKIRDHISG